MDIQRDIEDNYAEYLADELGYAWGVWDRLTLQEIEAHDRVLYASSEELDGIDVAGLNDLQRLAFMHACRKLGDVEGELAALRLIVSEPMEQNGVDYPEAHERLIDTLANRNEFDEARHVLEQLKSGDPDWARTPYIAAKLSACEDRTRAAEAFRELLESAPDDPELRYDVAEDLWAIGEHDAARKMLEEAAATGRRTGNDAVLVDIAVLISDWGDVSTG